MKISRLSTACAPACLSIGGGFCTGMTAGDCCPFFNGDTGDCVDNCTTTDVNFVYDENFTCGECIHAYSHIMHFFRKEWFSYSLSLIPNVILLLVNSTPNAHSVPDFL